ncbi:MAG: ABC transporter permease [Verrucomicrobiales bacterium]|nr:ABC transporter permease [Verrucomicrobiales bacterium]
MIELRLAFRRLLRTPGFTTVAVASLALGIGACTAVFSVVDAILLRALPVPDPQQLRVLQWTGWEARPRSITGRFETSGGRSIAESVSPALFQEMREQAAQLADLFAFAPLEDVIARAKSEAVGANGMIVSDNFFSALRVQPALGRLFSPGSSAPDAAHQVVISSEWWERHHGADPAVVGQSLSLNGAQYTVIGVLPRGFPGVRPRDPRAFYVLLTPQSQFLERAVSVTDHWWVRLMARIRPEVSDVRLEAMLTTVFARAAREQMQRPAVLVQPGRGGLAYDRDAYRRPLMAMLGAVTLVMLVACANLAGLSLARGAARRHELSVSAALGAGRWRLIRQSFTENLLLVAFGTALGVVLAHWGHQGILRLLANTAQEMPMESPLDLRVLTFTVLTALFTGLLSGLLPALRAGSVDPLGGLKARGTVGGPSLRTGRILVVIQVGLSLLLLAGAGLFLRSLASLQNTRAGFDTRRLLTFQVNPAPAGYKDAQLADFYERVQRSVASLPGVQGACVMVFPLLDNKGSSGGFSIQGRSDQSDAQQTHRLVVGESFLETLGVPLLAGRNLNAGDGENSAKVIVANEAFVKRYFPNENPIGRTIGTWRSEWRIVGVCGDIRYQNIKDPVAPTIYIPFRQFPLRSGAYFAVRTGLPPMEHLGAVRKAVAEIDPAVPVLRVATQEQIVDGTIRQERLSAAMSAALGGFALLLSCIGLYGLMAYNVTRRSSEFALRMALGAPTGEVTRSILRESVLLTSSGILLGLPAVLAMTRLIRNQLHGIEPHDPMTLAFVAIILLGVAVASAWLPARRAARINPLVALRGD